MITAALLLTLLSAPGDDALAKAIASSLPEGLVLESVVPRGKVPEGPLSVEWRTAPRPGTMTVLVRARDKSAVWTSLKLSKKAASIDLSVAPIARGTKLTVIATFGTARVSAPAILERSARIGEETAARLENGARVVRGRLIDAHTLVVGGENR